MASVIKSNDFNPSLIGFSAARKNKAGGIYVPITYNGESGVEIQFPVMIAPFPATGNTQNPPVVKPGEQRPKPARQDIVNYTVPLQFHNPGDESPETASLRDLHAKLEQVDEIVKQAAVEHTREWFNKPKLSEDTIANFFRPTIKKSVDAAGIPDGKWPDRLQLKMRVSNGNTTPIYTPTGDLYINKYPDEIINRGAKVIALMKLKSLWFVGGTQFGITYEPTQMVVIPAATRGGFAIVVPPSIKTASIEIPTSGAGDAIAAATGMNVINDADDDDAGPAAAAAAPAPATVSIALDDDEDDAPVPRATGKRPVVPRRK